MDRAKTNPQTAEERIEALRLGIENAIGLIEHVDAQAAVVELRARLTADDDCAARPRPELPDDQAWAQECLVMIREDLEAYGMDLTGCPPMMYNDALRSLVARLAMRAGLTTKEQVRAVVQAAERRAAPPEGER